MFFLTFLPVQSLQTRLAYELVNKNCKISVHRLTGELEEHGPRRKTSVRSDILPWRGAC